MEFRSPLGYISGLDLGFESRRGLSFLKQHEARTAGQLVPCRPSHAHTKLLR